MNFNWLKNLFATKNLVRNQRGSGVLGYLIGALVVILVFGVLLGALTAQVAALPFGGIITLLLGLVGLLIAVVIIVKLTAGI